MKTLIALATAALISTSAYATTVYSVSSQTTLRSDGFSDRMQAFDAGHDLAANIDQLDGQMAAKKLRVNKHDMIFNSLLVNGSEVTIEAFSPRKGEIMYRALVNVDYSYKIRDND
ncbi:DUF3316 domain-containing protein [Vibrio sp. SCSIO 43136]|uniref:DUF3316 domain-containing protein n=1 Tax=Vibrio sp. SCSIO 43136 TaxID=2819101 RepID=UPI002074DCD9|nr:DUF3316 domain-containing protein [Vibrio sp. SCSIO 43136]USD66930.1 DUF3316 domain-containing protein [Vibrio sp. SCSIO 43136]